MSQSEITTGVLLVGSVPLASSQEVFTELCNALPGRLRSIPDGETGERFNYIGWQKSCFPKETIKLYLGGVELPANESYPKYDLASVKPTRYDDVAISSYREFVALRAKGVIPTGVRFQVCLPTPLNSVQGHTRPEFHEQLEPLYEQRFQETLARIITEIPHENLVLQWDLCFDIIALEYDRGKVTDASFKPSFSPVKAGILDRVSRLCAKVPSTVHLAFHLCYGDLRHKHFVEPEDTGLLVELANDIIERQGKDGHTVEWIHMPVPKDRTDSAYFEPLNQLKLNGSYLYLGLVHANDEEGTLKRIGVAQSVFKQSFGVATECGLGRTPKEELNSILKISKLVAGPWSSHQV